MSMNITPSDGIYQAELEWAGMVREDVTALIAASFPVKPPRSWFQDPKLDRLTPLTVDNSGHVYGHIASWRQSHIGMAGGVRAPRSKSGYAFFATGAIQCDDGSMVNVGQITLTGGHAPLEASVAETVAHYDDTSSAIMDVVAGEDAHGIWVAGALRPDVDDIKLRSIRASSVSGDWRPINGNLELVAVCAVNVPGFPIPRARVASGQPVALVAAGTEDLARMSAFGAFNLDVQAAVTAAVDAIDQRLDMVESALLGKVRQKRASISHAVEKAKRNATERQALAASLRERAKPAVSSEPSEWLDGHAMEATVHDVLQASLRARVRDGVTATATSQWDTKHRQEAAKKGQALPDGSYPIKDKTDWHKAKQALGRAGKKRAQVVRHLKKRGRALGIPKAEWESIPMRAS